MTARVQYIMFTRLVGSAYIERLHEKGLTVEKITREQAC